MRRAYRRPTVIITERVHSCMLQVWEQMFRLTVTKLDPAALRHGTRLRCGGVKHQMKGLLIYYRHKTVFVGVPVTDRPV